MTTIRKQTSRQVKAAYRKDGGRVSEQELRRLEQLAAADRRAEELREKEKRKKDAKKKREERERKEREARLRNGIGDATQACGWNFTQRRQKDWFRTYFQKAQPKPVPEPKSADVSPFNSSPPSKLVNVDDEGGKLDYDACDENYGDACNGNNVIDDIVCNEEDRVDVNAHSKRDRRDAAVVPAPTPGSSQGSTSAHYNEYIDKLPDAFDRAINDIEIASRDDYGNDDEPWDTDGTDNDDILEAYDNVVAEVRSGPEQIVCERNPWSTDDIDEESLLAVVQGQTPTSKAALTTPGTPLKDLENDLPSMDATLLELDAQVAKSPATPAHRQRSASISDSFFSSELDLSAEDLAVLDAVVSRTQSTPSKTSALRPPQVPLITMPRALSNANPPASASRPLMMSPSRQAPKRKAEVADTYTSKSSKQQKTSTTRRGSVENSMLPPPRPPPRPKLMSPEVRRTATGSPRKSRYAAYGLSTQLIQDAAFEDPDF